MICQKKDLGFFHWLLYLVWNSWNLNISFSHFLSQSFNLSSEFTYGCILKQKIENYWCFLIKYAFKFRNNVLYKIMFSISSIKQNFFGYYHTLLDISFCIWVTRPEVMFFSFLARSNSIFSWLVSLLSVSNTDTGEGCCWNCKRLSCNWQKKLILQIFLNIILLQCMCIFEPLLALSKENMCTVFA